MTSTHSMATTSVLPRPSRPSFGPPSKPLPSLPVPKSRKSSDSSFIATPRSRRGSAASLVPSTVRTTSNSSLPTPQQSSTATTPLSSLKQAPRSGIPTSALPSPLPLASSNASATSSAAKPEKTIRKVVSIGSFPQPPASASKTSDTASPIQASSTSSLDLAGGPTPVKQRHSAGGRTAPPRSSSLAKSRIASRAASLRLPSGTTPSLLDNTHDRKSLTVPSPDSRSPSAYGSHSASAIDDTDDKRGRDPTPVDRAGTERHSSGKDSKDKGNVVVSVRVRPDATSGDGDRHKSDIEWMVDGRRSLVSYRGKEGGEYFYDNVFTTHDNNPKVYDSAAKRLVRRVMEGYHGTVFAYGMTGTGKTFSMQGTATNPGVIPLAITDIFSFIRETPHREFLLRVSYLEIYNEKIFDLLAVGQTGFNGLQAPQEEIKLREDSKRGVYATPLKEEIVQSPTQLLRVIARGDNARRTGSTQWNARSSRSHAVVQIVVESRERAGAPGDAGSNKKSSGPPGGVRVSTLSLIDLAGSEKAAENKERRQEGAHINKSLLTLGSVISNLSGDKDKPGGAKDGKHLPYRDSKLTRLLQPALSGNSLVSILCTIQIGSAGSVASAQGHAGETLNTLKFASRAKNNIVSHAKKAEEAVATSGAAAALLDRYRLEIQDLRKQLDEVKTQKAAEGPVAANAATGESKPREQDELDLEAERKKDEERETEHEQRHEEQMLEMQLARTALKERIEHLNRLILSSKSVGVNANRSFSSMSMQRQSVASNHSDYGARSHRSSAATIEASSIKSRPNSLGRNSSAASLRSSRGLSTMTTSTMNGGASGPGGPENSSDDGLDITDENPDGTASLALQMRALQADLADKNRYITTLEKRLLQARRSSNSRVSIGFTQSRITSGQGLPNGEGDNAVEQLLREKDAEIAELRARLDDKDRMVSALRSAARKRDLADLSLETGSAINGDSRRSSTKSPASQTVSPRVSVARVVSGMSISSSSPGNNSEKPGLSRANSGGGSVPPRGHKSVDSVTKLLDEMIREKVASQRMSGGREDAIEEEEEDTGARTGYDTSGVNGDRVDSGIVVKAPVRTTRRSSSVKIVTP